MYPHKLLVIDDNTDNGMILVRTLIRKFPHSAVEFCRETGAAVAVVGTEKIDVVVLHRSVEEDAISLIKQLLKVAPKLPIIVVSGIDRSETVLAAGAVGFMNYDQWLRIGTFVENVLKDRL